MPRSPVLEVKADDERPELSDTLEAADGSAIDLSNASEVRLFVRHRATDTLVVNQAATIDDATNGSVSYAFQDGELDRVGRHLGEWEITWSDGDEQTIPPDHDLYIDVAESVEGDGSVADTAPAYELTTGTFTLVGGQTSTTHVVQDVTGDQLKLFDVLVAPDVDPSWDADYAFNLEWSRRWDDTNSHVDVELVVTWDTDPGAGNDLELRYSIQERE